MFGIWWIYLICFDVKYILKVDDDMFVNLLLFVVMLEGYYYKVDRNGVIFGNINGDVKVRCWGMWKVNEIDYFFFYFLLYVYGNIYVIFVNIVGWIFSVLEYMLYILIEDVYIMGILVKVIDVCFVFVLGFIFWLDYKLNYCDFVNDNRIFVIKVSFKYMFYFWEKIYFSEVDC